MITSDATTTPAAVAKDIAYYDKLAGVYFDRHRWPIQAFTTRVESAWLHRFVPVGASVLLAGSGGGREIAALAERGCSITTLDYSPAMTDLARKTWGHRGVACVCGDVHDPAAVGGPWDAIVSLAAINYFADPPAAVRTLAGSLRPNGTLVISSINARHPTERDASASGTRRPLSPDELKGMIRDAGCETLTIKGLRVFVDRLPPRWNHAGAPRVGRGVLAAGLALERLLSGRIPPRMGKFFWAVAQKPVA
jgi:SAM-dependent methyltransferase